MSNKSELTAMAKLNASGYGFNKAGELRKIDKTTNKLSSEPFKYYYHNYYSLKSDDQLHHKLNAAIFEMLERRGLKRTYIPHNVPQNKGSFFFSQPEHLKRSKKLLVLIYGYAGQWSRELIVNKSLKHGSQLQYIKRAQALGYDLLVMNIFDNTRLSCDKRLPIPHLNNPWRHAAYVWERHVMPTQPESVAIIAHCFSGRVTMNLIASHLNFFREKVFGIAFMSCEHWDLSDDIFETIGKRSCNWMMDSRPLDTVITNPCHRNAVRCVSAGPESLEQNVPYVACKSIFRFLENKYREFDMLTSN